MVKWVDNYSAKLEIIHEFHKKSGHRLLYDRFYDRLIVVSELVTHTGQGNTLLTDTKLGKTAHMLTAGLNANQ